MTKWIGRNKRGNKIVWTKYLLWLLVPIAVFLIILTYGDRINRKLSTIFTSRNDLATPEIVRKPLNTDSLLYAIITDLGLDSSLLVEGYSNTSLAPGKYSPYYFVKWPQAYPLIWFTYKLRGACCARDSLRYDALELDNGRKLNVVLVERRDTLARVELATDNRCKPAQSKAAIIFDDFGIMTKSQIVSLVKIGIPFGYFLNPDQFPDNETYKILKTCRGECYLRLPTDKDSWAAIMKKIHLGGAGKTMKFNDKNLELLLRRFPVIDGFIFDERKGMDRGTVQMLLKQLSKWNPVYLNLGNTSTALDTLVRQSGLKIGIPVEEMDLKGLSSIEFVGRFKADFGKAAIRPNMIYLAYSRSGYIKAIDDLADFRSRWNVKMVPPSAQLEYLQGH